jgi:hypothetical protein
MGWYKKSEKDAFIIERVARVFIDWIQRSIDAMVDGDDGNEALPEKLSVELSMI